ncbi:hypothetical protein [Kordiimonas aestuarii]|nr:hypothetical protein [Kordiimonas aestuarii]
MTVQGQTGLLIQLGETASVFLAGVTVADLSDMNPLFQKNI